MDVTAVSSSDHSPLWRRLTVKGGKRVLRWAGRFQAKHSLVSTRPLLDRSEFACAKPLEDGYSDIRSELGVLLEHPESIPSFHQISPDQKRISRGTHWKTFAFYVYGHRVDDNCAQCPRTAAVLDSLPGIETAMFSILAPRYHIKPHKGPTRAVVRAHLGLVVPKDWKNVWMRVEDQIVHWKPGKVLFFDDTYEHEVYNDTDEARAVLFIDIDRPMDRVGTLFNRSIVRLISASMYVRQPLRNLALWNEKQRMRSRTPDHNFPPNKCQESSGLPGADLQPSSSGEPSRPS